jgi:hypothetical protein
MPQQGISTWLKVAGAISVVVVSFFVTLQIFNLSDGPSDTGASATFMDAVNALNAGEVVVVEFDPSPLEDRDESGLIACGPDTVKGYLGALVAGERYEVVFEARTRSWKVTGPYQVLPTCGRYSETYGPAQLGGTKARPENGDLILWGAAMTFDAKLDVYDSSRRKVGHLTIRR